MGIIASAGIGSTAAASVTGAAVSGQATTDAVKVSHEIIAPTDGISDAENSTTATALTVMTLAEVLFFWSGFLPSLFTIATFRGR